MEVYNTISGSIQCYQWKYTILSVEVYNTISGSIQYSQWKYTILSAEVQHTILSVEVYDTISIQYYQWKYTILHTVYSVGATQLWFRVRVPFVDSILNIQRNSSSITKDHSADPQSQFPTPPPPRHIPLELCNCFQYKFISKTCNLHQSH